MSVSNYLELIKAARALSKNERGYLEIKLAVLGDSTTQQLVPVLKSILHHRGLFASVYEAGFDVIDAEVFDANSGLYRFAPDYVLFYTSTKALRARYYKSAADASLVESAHTRMLQRWGAVNERLACRIIQNLHELPLERPFGNYTQKIPDAFASLVAELNRRVVVSSRGQANVFLNDMDYLASEVGKRSWSNERFWIHGKLSCDPEYLPKIAESLAAIILAGSARAKKCVVLDLDNTLWGGVIGDDGLNGIELGDHGLGEAYVLFQYFLKSLKNRGILLAVCSKNERETALAAFRDHPNMILREKDISCFVANWQSKSDNLRAIAATLNIGTDSLVFLDDSAFERNEVRAALPEVCVPEMPDDPADYVSFLNGLDLFETIAFSQEDRERTALYGEQAAREQVKAQFTDIGDYLKSLDMRATLARFDPFHLPRIVQLIQRSNQFNLTTKRYNEQECAAFMRDEKSCYPIWVSLADKFGDYGLIGVIILKREHAALFIDTWLMSCRVLQRGVERLCMNHIIEFAAKNGCRTVEGVYAPTEKNGLVREFYAGFGFKKTAESEDRSSKWSLSVSEYRAEKIHIESVPGAHGQS